MIKHKYILSNSGLWYVTYMDEKLVRAKRIYGGD